MAFGSVTEYSRSKAGELTLLEAVPAGEHPHDLALSPDGTNLYVADNQMNGKVYEFTRAAGTGELTELANIEAGENTESVVVSPDGSDAYAANEVSNDVSQYSRSGGGELAKLAEAILAGGKPEGIAISPGGNNVYVANAGSGSVSQYSRSVPIVESITPTQGPTAGGTSVKIKGKGFVSPATVKIGSAATSVTVVSETEITAKTAATARRPPGSDRLRRGRHLNRRPLLHLRRRAHV